MFTGIDRNEIRKYISPKDPDKAKPTKFLLSLLDPSVRNYIEEATSSLEFSSKNPDDSAKANISMNKRNDLVVKYGLKGLEDFLDPKGQLVEFKVTTSHLGGKMVEGVSADIMAMLPANLKAELANIIWEEEKLSEESEKN